MVKVFFKNVQATLSNKKNSAGITLMENGELIIQRVKKEDEGMYKCQASNSIGVATSSAVITVLGEYQIN